MRYEYLDISTSSRHLFKLNKETREDDQILYDVLFFKERARLQDRQKMCETDLLSTFTSRPKSKATSIH